MDWISKEYYTRELTSKYLYTRLEEVYKVIESTPKLFKVNRDKTKVFYDALEPLKLINIGKVLVKGSLEVEVHHISVQPSYGHVELTMSYRVRDTDTQGSGTHDKITFNLGKFAYNKEEFKYTNTLESLRPLKELEEALEVYNPYDLNEIFDRLKEREELEGRIKKLEGKLPYWSYR